MSLIRLRILGMMPHPQLCWIYILMSMPSQYNCEIHDGITMWCADDHPSPFSNNRSDIFAVHFDNNTFVDNMTFNNCVLINLSFRGCILSNVRLTNVYLHDMEFVDCHFNDFHWLNKREFDQTWTGQTFEQRTIMGDSMPEEVRGRLWLLQMKHTQFFPEKVHVEREPTAEYMNDLKLIYERVHSAPAPVPDPIIPDSESEPQPGQ